MKKSSTYDEITSMKGLILIQSSILVVKHVINSLNPCELEKNTRILLSVTKFS